MGITPRMVRTSQLWRHSIIIIIKMEDQLELPLILLMLLPQANSNSSSSSSNMVVISSLPIDTSGLLPIMTTPISNGNSTKEAIVRTMAVGMGDTLIIMMGGMAIELEKRIGCPLMAPHHQEVAPIVIIIIIIIILVAAGVRGVVVEVTEVISTMVENMIIIMTTGVIEETMTGSDTGDERTKK